MGLKICLSVASMEPSFENLMKELNKVAQVQLVGLDGFSLEGYDIFIGKKLSESILATADKLKVIFAYKTGVDDFPMEALIQKGIKLVNTHADADYIAEYAFGLSISLVNRITECDKKLRRGIWYDIDNPYWRSFFTMKVGLLGYGHIGRQVHKLLLRNQIETYTIDRGREYENIHLVSNLEQLCRETDLIIISLPKTEETNCVINKEMIQLMKDKYIVNVGRSNCIDQKALYEALKSEWLAGAANDTWDQKPKSPSDLWEQLSDYDMTELENIVLSPHQAMRVKGGHERYVMDILDKVLCYIKDGSLRDVVDLSKGY